MLIVIGAVALLAALASPALPGRRDRAGRAARAHRGPPQRAGAAVPGRDGAGRAGRNLGLLWVAIEATTIVTAFLVGHHRTRAAVEAAWKYVVLCSAGIAIAFLGIVLLYYAARARRPQRRRRWTGPARRRARRSSTRLSPASRIALLIVGFGTKAGLAPLHAWLPDAHSQAPAPVSALMSGVLLSVAFYAILRVKVIADAALGPGSPAPCCSPPRWPRSLWPRRCCSAQRDYKRMLAYSSIEHMGLLALGAAVGSTLAIAAVLLHILGHGLAKSVLFLGAGRILQLTGTSQIGGVRGLAARQPLLAGCLGAGVLALLGLPPFSLFASELGIARAGFTAGVGWATAAALIFMIVIAAALLNHLSRMLLGGAPDGPGTATARRRLPPSTAAALIAGLLGCVALGLATGPLTALLQHRRHHTDGHAMTDPRPTQTPRTPERI